MTDTPLTPAEIEVEMEHIWHNRMGEFCPNGETPTAEQEALVAAESAEWYARYRLKP